jgi:hypothetical protein
MLFALSVSVFVVVVSIIVLVIDNAILRCAE